MSLDKLLQGVPTFNEFEILYSGIFTSPATSISAGGAGVYSASSVSSTVFTHGLGYAPYVVAFLENGTGYLPMPYFFLDAPSGSTAYWGKREVEVNTLSVVLRTTIMGVNTAQSLATANVRIYLLRERSK